MTVQRLSIHHIRNLRNVSIQRPSRINIVYGSNGSGKTSVLESLNILGMARSFRSNKTANIVTHGEKKYTVFGELADGVAVGVEKSTKGDSRIQVSGRPLKSVAELIPYLPVQVINSSSFGLLTGSPTLRRQYLDWGVFHVEHAFLKYWQRFQRAIKQRNVLLRRGRMEGQELSVWDREVCQSGYALHKLRSDYFEQLAHEFAKMCERLIPELNTVELRLKAGWDVKVGLEAVLAANLVSDTERGFTQAGPHRSDIRVMMDGYLAADVLSRGQTKLVVCALKLAQGVLLSQHRQRKGIYLVDDLPAELDSTHCERVCDELTKLDTQLWMTCIERDSLVPFFGDRSSDLKMFHVEHGQVNDSPTLLKQTD